MSPPPQGIPSTHLLTELSEAQDPDAVMAAALQVGPRMSAMHGVCNGVGVEGCDVACLRSIIIRGFSSKLQHAAVQPTVLLWFSMELCCQHTGPVLCCVVLCRAAGWACASYAGPRECVCASGVWHTPGPAGGTRMEPATQ